MAAGFESDHGKAHHNYYSYCFPLRAANITYVKKSRGMQ